MTPPTVTPDELLPALRLGDPSAFDAIFREYYTLIVAVAERVTRERALAEEIAQDVMLELWRLRERLDFPGPLRAYLCRAARNRALNHVRHLRVVDSAAPTLASEERAPPRASDLLEESEINAAAAEAIESLPPRCREVFELSRLSGLSYGEIADQLGISTKTVEVHMGRALRTLRDALEAWIPEGGLGARRNR